MNKRKKGLYYEKLIKSILEQQGYAVCRAYWKPLYIKGKLVLVGADIFGCDLVAIKQDKPVRFIQVTSSPSIKQKLNKLLSYPFPPEHSSVEIWLVKNKSIKIYKIDKQGSVSTYEIPKTFKTPTL